MAYNGYLVKVGSYTIPLSLIKADSYIPFLSYGDADSYTDANYVLHRNATGIAPKIEFETIPLLTNIQFAEFMSNLRSQYIIGKEKKCSVTAYQP